MKSLILVIPLLLSGPAAGQDMEPNLRRAAASLASRLDQLLPGLHPAPQALALLCAPGGDPAVPSALLAALREDGYEVELSARAPLNARVLVLRVSSTSGPELGRISLDVETPEGQHMVCLYAAADWVDDPPPAAVQVEGPFRTDRTAAVAAAYDLAWKRLRGRHGLPSTERARKALLSSCPRRLLVTQALADGGQHVFRAWLQVLPDRHTLRRMERHARSRAEARHWRPIKRAGALLFLTLILLLAYLHTDLRTRGYLTTPLRVLFGILFVIGIFACWTVAL